MTRIKGLEALFSACKDVFKAREDCVVAAIHCMLINADLLCVGIGETFSNDDSDSASELLPDNWNGDLEVYCLRYMDQDFKECYLLKIVKAGRNLHVNLVKGEDVASGLTVNTDEFVSDNFTKFSETFKALDKLSENIQQNMISQVKASGKKSDESAKTKSSKKEKTPNRQTSTIPARVPIPQVQPIPTGVPDTRRQGGSPLSAFPRIGGNDLDPLGRSEGSMLFDPSRMGIPHRPLGPGIHPGFRQPPYGVPPGARFDPFGPPDVGLGGRFNPDPDHFRPPDYDNMFM